MIGELIVVLPECGLLISVSMVTDHPLNVYLDQCMSKAS